MESNELECQLEVGTRDRGWSISGDLLGHSKLTKCNTPEYGTPRWTQDMVRGLDVATLVHAERGVGIRALFAVQTEGGNLLGRVASIEGHELLCLVYRNAFRG